MTASKVNSRVSVRNKEALVHRRQSIVMYVCMHVCMYRLTLENT